MSTDATRDLASDATSAAAIAAATAAFERLRDALNAARDPVRLRAAVVDEVQIDRHAPGARGAAPRAESFAGVAEVERWLARTPAVVQFALAGAARAEPSDPGDPGAPREQWIVEYAYAAEDFHNGGIWVARLAGDGRIAFLSHHPFALRDAPPAAPDTPHAHGGIPHAHGGSGHPHGG
jgi:hypothetical protein